MHVYDPRDWQGGRGEGREPHDPNETAMLRVGLAVALSLFFASLLPLPMVPAALSQLLFIAGLGAVGVAILRSQPLLAEYFTSWDEAAAFLALSYAVELFWPLRVLDSCPC